MSTKNKRIFLSPPHMSGKELEYIGNVFEQNWIAPVGPHVDAFEESISRFTGVKHTAVLSSGTAAIHLGLKLLGVGPGDAVIASSFTFSATVNPIVYLGATPVLVDSEPDTWNMDPQLLERAIRDRIGKDGKHRIKAIIVVHLYGMPAKMEEISAIAGRYNIPLVEDAAEALGSRYRDRPAGSMGKIGIFSFNGNKIITTSGGGALVSGDGNLVKKTRFLATQSRDDAPHYQHSEIGYNYRLSNVLAGIGLGQMEALEERIEQRRSRNKWYRELLEGIPGISFQSEPSVDYFSNFWLTCIVIDPELLGTDREHVRQSLEKEDIESRPLWKPMHLQPVFKDAPAYVNGNSEALFRDGLSLPSGSGLTAGELERIASAVKNALPS